MPIVIAAPNSRAIISLSGAFFPMTMMFFASITPQHSVVSRPIGPAPWTTTVWPGDTFTLLAPWAATASGSASTTASAGALILKYAVLGLCTYRY